MSISEHCLLGENSRRLEIDFNQFCRRCGYEEEMDMRFYHNWIKMGTNYVTIKRLVVHYLSATKPQQNVLISLLW